MILLKCFCYAQSSIWSVNEGASDASMQLEQQQLGTLRDTFVCKCSSIYMS